MTTWKGAATSRSSSAVCMISTAASTFRRTIMRIWSKLSQKSPLHVAARHVDKAGEAKPTGPKLSREAAPLRLVRQIALPPLHLDAVTLAHRPGQDLEGTGPQVCQVQVPAPTRAFDGKRLAKSARSAGDQDARSDLVRRPRIRVHDRPPNGPRTSASKAPSVATRVHVQRLRVGAPGLPVVGVNLPGASQRHFSEQVHDAFRRFLRGDAHRAAPRPHPPGHPRRALESDIGLHQAWVCGKGATADPDPAAGSVRP